jgi:hypothetical protein
MPDAHKNFPYSLVATAPSPATTGISLVVTAGQGALFPATPFNASVWPASAQPLASNAEIVTVTNITGDTFTIVRQAEGTSVRAIAVGDQIAATITNKTLTDNEGNRLPSADARVRSGFSTSLVGDVELPAGSIYELESDGVLEIV